MLLKEQRRNQKKSTKIWNSISRLISSSNSIKRKLNEKVFSSRFGMERERRILFIIYRNQVSRHSQSSRSCLLPPPHVIQRRRLISFMVCWLVVSFASRSIVFARSSVSSMFLFFLLRAAMPLNERARTTVTMGNNKQQAEEVHESVFQFFNFSPLRSVRFSHRRYRCRYRVDNITSWRKQTSFLMLVSPDLSLSLNFKFFFSHAISLLPFCLSFSPVTA